MNDSHATVWNELTTTLECEISEIGRLVRLAHRQNRYLVRRDTRRIATNLRAMDEGVARVKDLYVRRTGALVRLGVTTTGRKGLKSAVAVADTPWRERVEALEAALTRVMELLGRKNLQNYQLTRFSLDLVGEEMRLLLGASDGPGTTYDAAGGAGDPALSGAVDGRA